jgi:Ubiquitin family
MKWDKPLPKGNLQRAVSMILVPRPTPGPTPRCTDGNDESLSDCGNDTPTEGGSGLVQDIDRLLDDPGFGDGPEYDDDGEYNNMPSLLDRNQFMDEEESDDEDDNDIEGDAIFCQQISLYRKISLYLSVTSSGSTSSGLSLSGSTLLGAKKNCYRCRCKGKGGKGKGNGLRRRCQGSKGKGKGSDTTMAQILFKTWDKTVTLDVELSAPIQPVKELIYDKVAVPPNQQRLTFGCKQLEEATFHIMTSRKGRP